MPNCTCEAKVTNDAVLMSDELLKALKLIKATCIEQQDCGTCPMHTHDEGCGMRSDEPAAWPLEPRITYF